jgi:outer membrane protein, multidrug efflux system
VTQLASRVQVMASFALTSALVSGCASVGPNYARPDMAPPATFRDAGEPQAPGTLADIPWWQVFQDDALQALIRDAIAHNHDLRVAVARVQEARALARVARSFLYPDIGLSAFTGGNQASRNSQPAVVGEDDD